MSNIKDLTGQRFGRLIALEMNGRDKSGRIIWKCKCDCGNETNVVSRQLIRGSTKSCGCLSRELSSKRNHKYNIYDLSNQYGIGYTQKGEPFYFDLEDYDIIKDHCWRIEPSGYVVSNNHNGTPKTLKIHNLIMNHRYVDHLGGKETRNDNRKSNLRIPPDNFAFATYNQMNKTLQSNNTSGYTGVYYSKNKWKASLKINKQYIYLGTYDNFDDAVRARKEAEQKYFGEYSYDNSQLLYRQTQELKVDEMEGEKRNG